MLFLVCESLKMGGVQSLYLRLALESSKPITIISLTESHDDAFIKSLHENDIPYFYYSDFSQWSIGTKRATMANSIPLSSRKVLLQFNTPVSYFHVSSLSGAVFVHRLSKLIRNQSKVKLNVGIYHGLIFGWKSSFNTYYSRLSSEILKGFFGEFGVLFYNKVVQTSYEKKLGCALSGDIIPIGIRVKK
ncbi:hypothetical protein GPAL_3013 [Glaciecola pallidula DSM 14239 = ACAM 615]|uniref:Uncharacterized protein n=2 Tax=Brumicola TaxID=3160924 RepID=K6YAV2_9ALTE|nr:hypothetical protein GPAL_3013 [Glaciecola pallidula DSM 14239 = ACAM 615]